MKGGRPGHRKEGLQLPDCEGQIDGEVITRMSGRYWTTSLGDLIS